MVAEIELNTVIRDVVCADLVADRAPEVAVITPQEIRVYRTDGTLRRARAFPDAAFGRALTSDVDDDGKADLIVGSVGSATAEITVINGLLQTLSDIPIVSTIDGVTTPHHVRGDSVFVTSYSRANSTPKFAASVSVRTGLTVDFAPMGPRPMSFDMSAQNGRWLVAAMGVVQEGRNPAFAYDHAHNRHGLLFFEPHSAAPSFVPTSGPVGWNTESGDATSYPTAHFFLASSGEERVAMITHAVGGLSRVQSAVTIMSNQGKVVRRVGFNHQSEATAAVLPPRSDARVVMAWDAAGVLLTIDEEGTVLRERTFGVTETGLRLLAFDHLSGVGRSGVGAAPVLLVANHDTLYLLDEDLNDLARFQLEYPVSGAAFARTTPTSAELIAWGSRLSFLHYQAGTAGDSHVAPEHAPAAADADATRAPLVERSYTWTDFHLEERLVRNRFNYHDAWTSQELFSLDGRQVLAVADFLPSSGTEFLVHRPLESALRVLSTDGVVLSTIDLEGAQPAGWQTIGDFDGDGYADLALYLADPIGVRIVNGSGQTLFRHRLAYWWDTYLACAYWDNEIIVLAVNAGFRRQPRGALLIDRTNSNRTRYLGGANAVALRSVMVTDHHVLIPGFSASNGALYHHGNLGEETDRELALKVFDRTTGTLAAMMRSVYPHPYNRGYLVPFSISASDGSRQLFVAEAKFGEYYPGIPVLHRVNVEDWSLQPVLTGPRNSTVLLPYAGRYEGEPAVFVMWASPHAVDVLSADLSTTLRPRSESEVPFYLGVVRVMDLDGDGTSELIGLHGNAVCILNAHGRLVAELTSADEPLRDFLVDDTASDGRLRILAWDHERVTRYVPR